jgi:hypothetical protein
MDEIARETDGDSSTLAERNGDDWLEDGADMRHRDPQLWKRFSGRDADP